MKQRIMKRHPVRLIVALLVLAVSSYTAHCDMIVDPAPFNSTQIETTITRSEKAWWIIGILAIFALFLVLTLLAVRRKSRKTRILVGAFCAAILITVMAFVSALGRESYDPVRRRLERAADGSISVHVECAEDLVDPQKNNTVFLGTILTVGQLDEKRTTKIWLGQHSYKCYYVDATVQVEKTGVWSGGQNIAGEIITVRELLIANHDGSHEPSRLLNEDISRAVFCTNWNSEYFQIEIPEYDIIPVKENESITIWPFLEHASDYQTLDSFEEMARHHLGNAFRADLGQIGRLATDEELMMFQAAFEQQESGTLSPSPGRAFHPVSGRLDAEYGSSIVYVAMGYEVINEAGITELYTVAFRWDRLAKTIIQVNFVIGPIATQ